MRIDGEPIRYVVEVGPVTFRNADGRRDLSAMERQTRDELDGVVRDYLRVGRYSKSVRTRIER